MTVALSYGVYKTYMLLIYFLYCNRSLVDVSLTSVALILKMQILIQILETAF